VSLEIPDCGRNILKRRECETWTYPQSKLTTGIKCEWGGLDRVHSWAFQIGDKSLGSIRISNLNAAIRLHNKSFKEDPVPGKLNATSHW